MHGWWRLALCPLMLAGCTAEDIHVTQETVAPEAVYRFYSEDVDNPRTVFSTDEEKVTLSVRFGYNIVATYFAYVVEWIAPGGAVYQRLPTRTEWGTHRALTATLPIRGTGAVQHPGEWRVRLYLQGRLLTERRFTLERSEAAAAAAHVPAVPDCPPVDRPPGDCVEIAPGE